MISVLLAESPYYQDLQLLVSSKIKETKDYRFSFFSATTPAAELKLDTFYGNCHLRCPTLTLPQEYTPPIANLTLGKWGSSAS